MRRAALILIAIALPPLCARGAESFVAFKAEDAFELPVIVLQHDPVSGSGFEWSHATARPAGERSDLGKVRDAVRFLQEAIQKITGKELPVRNGTDLARGIILTTLAGAPPDIRDDPAVVRALQNDGTDAYNDKEAFYLQSEPERLLVLANTADGLAAAVAELMESIGYEVLGMGPNWVHVPSEHRRELVFNIERAGRPSYYIRGLNPTSGQTYGVGTIMPRPATMLSDPADEPVPASYARWAVGARVLGQSMPGFPGHAMQAYHRAVVARLRETGTTDGFLVPRTVLGADSERPAATMENARWLWINTDGEGTPAAGKVFLSDGSSWTEQNLASLAANLDLSVPLVREIVLEDMKAKAEAHFARQPDRVFVFGTDPEDGSGYAALGTLIRHRDWYPEDLKSAGIQFGSPYVLHLYRGLDQPHELWDADAPSDTVFGFNNWLLREFDSWIDSFPPQERVTSTGDSKKELARCSLYSYNYHDVPPNFNLDPRIRVMVAGYPKFRGLGKWKQFASQQDIARAFQLLLPREPSGDYRIISLAYFQDFSADGIPPGWSAAPASIVGDLQSTRGAGIRAINYEIDFNFGKYGLAYYLLSKTLWNTELTAAELDKLRNRWLERAYGHGWQEMKSYYDLLLPENYPVNGPNTWARAIRLIAAADEKIDPETEPDEQRRLDDLKQFWYFHYLLRTDEGKPDSRAMQEFAWKGQMSYMVPMHVVMRRIFGTGQVAEAVPEPIRSGPAHYTAEETQEWWNKVLEHWPLVPVTLFAEGTLSNGRPAREVDLNDLVRVEDFPDQGGTPFFYNSGYMQPVPFLTVSRRDEPIGFTLSWPAKPGNDRYYLPKELPYGVDRWDASSRAWLPIVDKTMTVQKSVEIETTGGQTRHLVEVKLTAPADGTYRFEIGYGGNLALLSHLGYDARSGTYADRHGHTCFTTATGLTQSPVWIYIPKGTRSLDLEVWDDHKLKKVVLHRDYATETRKVEISARGTHRVELQAGEDGSLARIEGNGFAFPFLYSVPMYWAKSPAELLVPRAIAEADGLTILE